MKLKQYGKRKIMYFVRTLDNIYTSKRGNCDNTTLAKQENGKKCGKSEGNVKKRGEQCTFDGTFHYIDTPKRGNCNNKDAGKKYENL